MKRSILLSLLVIGAAVSLIGAGSLAYFSDTETSSGNALMSGTLDLKVDGKDDPNLGVYMAAGNVAPGDVVYTGVIVLSNVGNIDGTADLHFWNIEDADNGLNEPECVAEGGTWDPNETPPCQGPMPVYDLSSHIAVDYQYDNTIDSQCTGPEVWKGKLADIESDTFDIGPLPAGSSAEVCLSFHLQDVGNEYQGDSTSFDIEFTLHQ